MGAFYMGGLYGYVNSALSFAVFSVWQKAGEPIYGWFFNIFERFQVY